MSGVSGISIERLDNFLAELLDIYSPSGKELGAVTFVKERLGSAGIHAAMLEVEEERPNLLVSADSKRAPVLFLGHIDTVPAYDFDNFGYRREGDVVYGLGASDMKSGCAAMVEAFISYHERYRRLPAAALALVVGEEESGDGAEALVDTFRSSWAIVGEPSDMTPALGHYAYAEIELNTSGPRTHASLASNDHNAVYAMLKVLQQVTGFLEQNYPDAVYNIRDVHSSRRGFAVPDRCTAALDVHLPPRAPQGEMVVGIEDLLSHCDISSSVTLESRFPTVHGGYELPARGKLPKALREVYDARGHEWKTTHFRSHSDANVLWAAGIKPVVLGPGQLARAHAENESVSFAQVVEAAEVYYDLLCALS